jgi:hypothetical protein
MMPEEGLDAEWRGDFVRGTFPARYFEHLWPVLS